MNLNKCAKLDKAVEAKLLVEYQGNRSQRTRDRLFENYYPLVKKIAYDVYRRSPKGRIDLTDLLHEASCGLLIAIDKFDPSKAETLYPVAYLWIREYTHRAIMKNLSMVRDLSTNSKTRTLYHRFRRTVAELKFERPLTEYMRETLATRLKVPVLDIEFFETVMDDFIDIDGLTQMFYDPQDAENIEYQADAAKLKSFIFDRIVPSLSDKERYILDHRILADDGRVEDIAEMFNQSKAAIYQTEKRIVEDIRKRFIEEKMTQAL